MFLLAISGGPDSMFLLDQYKHKKVVVAHVNYHKRSDSNYDQKIVEAFCQKYNIPCQVLNVIKIPQGNFQNEARKIRYDFFKKIYDEYDCQKLLTAHHMDDFIETALLQQRSNRTPNYFGIAKKNKINGLVIYRPFVNSYFKVEIIKKLEARNIAFAIDSSNDLPIFERNKIRLELKTKSIKEKQDMFSWFQLANKILQKKIKRVKKVYKKWELSDFQLKKFRVLERDKERLVYMFVHSNFTDIKLSSAKIKSLIDFIEGSKGNVAFKLKDKVFVYKEYGKLIIKK